MSGLFGDPSEGTLAFWFVNKGLWILLVVLISIIGWLVVRHFSRIWIRWVLRKLKLYDPYTPGSDEVRLFEWIIEGTATGTLIGIAASLAVLAILGVDIDPALSWLTEAGRSVRSWIAGHGFRIVFILAMGWFGVRVLQRAIPGIVRSIVLRDTAPSDIDEVTKRAETLGNVFSGICLIVIIVVVSFTVLLELEIPVGAVLGGVGITGIAVGFGAQHLIKDLIAGVFVLAENQYRQGDVVEIAGKAGLVESINLRRTVLRDLDGKVHTVPNGEITVASNFTKQWSRVNLDIEVAYRTNLQQAIDVLNQVGDKISHDPHFGLLIIDPPQVLRVNSFGGSGIAIKMLGVCKPLKQWEIMGELRKRIHVAFNEEGIEIPYPHMTVYWGEGSHPLHGNQGSENVMDEAPNGDGNSLVAANQMTQAERQAAVREMALAAEATRQRIETGDAANSDTSADSQNDEERRIREAARLRKGVYDD